MNATNIEPQLTKLHSEMRNSRLEAERARMLQLRAEQAMNQCEAQLRLILGTVPVAIGRCDSDGRYIFANHLFAECYGMTPEIIAGRLMSELLSPAEWTTMEPYLERVRAGHMVEIEHDLPVPGLGLRHLQCKVSPEITPQGLVDGWLIVAADITAQKQAEQAVAHNAMRQKIISDSLAHLVGTNDSEGIISTLFPKVAQHVQAEIFTNFLLPEGSQELVLHCHAGLSPEMEVALARLPVGVSLCGLVAQTRAALIVSDLHLSEDPRSAPLRDKGFKAYCGVPLIIEGKLVGTLGFASRTKGAFTGDELEFIELIARYASLVINRVHSERRLRENEERFRSLFENNLDAIFSFDRNGRFYSSNPAASRLSGYSEDELGAINFHALCVPEDFKRTREAFQQCLAGQPQELEMAMLREDGARLELFVSSIPIQVGSEMAGVFVIARDITERKRAESALMLSKEQLEERVQERTSELRQTMRELHSEFIERRRLEGEILRISEREQARIGQDLHDDLGQQLAGMAMLAKLLSTSLINEHHAKAGEATQLATYLTQSIRSTRDLAKSLFPVELERGGFLMALQDLAQRTESLTKVSCEVVAHPSFVCARSAEIHLYRIVQESLNNAIRHGRSTRLTIDCRALDGIPTMTVTDNGTGLKQTHENSRGMGLHLFQYRARLIGAELTLHSLPTGGCKVVCSFKEPLP